MTPDTEDNLASPAKPHHSKKIIPAGMALGFDRPTPVGLSMSMKDELLIGLHRDSLLIFEHLVAGPFSHTVGLRPPTSVAPLAVAQDAVAQCVWALWPHNRDRVWQLLLDWAGASSSVLTEAARTILSRGLTGGLITLDDCLEQAKSWISSGDRAQQEAASELLPGVLPLVGADGICGVCDRLRESGSLTTLSRVMADMLQRDFKWTMQAYCELARKRPGVYDHMISNAFRGAVPPKGQAPDFYRALSRGLLLLKALLRSKPAQATLKQVIKEVRARMSQLRNQPDPLAQHARSPKARRARPAAKR